MNLRLRRWQNFQDYLEAVFINNKQPSRRAVENARLSEKIKDIHEHHRGIYGSPRIHAELKRDGENCSRKRVARLMSEQGLKARTHKAWKVTTKRAVK